MKPVQIIQNWASEGPGHIVSYLEAQGIPFKVRKGYDNESLEGADGGRALIVMGCPTSVRDYLQHENLKRVFACMSSAVRRRTPVLGVCFGGQMLARIHGARVEKNDVREIGIYDASLTAAGKSDPLFKGFPPAFKVFHWHGDTFRIPFEAVHVVEGISCRNQAFRLGNAVGVQFHLETTAEDVPRWCDEYLQELEEESKTKDEIVAEFESHEKDLRVLSDKLLGNFFGLA